MHPSSLRSSAFRRSSEVTIKIHALVQNSNNFDLISANSKKDHVRTDGVFAITRAYLITGAPSRRIRRDRVDSTVNQTDISFGLFSAPSVGRVVPDIVEIATSLR